MSKHFKDRQFYIQILFIIVGVVLVGKLAQLQIFDRKFRDKADAITWKTNILYPSRGLIYDRNKEIVVNNNPMYDLLLTYNQFDPEMDIEKFCDLLKIKRPIFEKNIKKNWSSARYSKSHPFVFLSKIDPKIYATFQESLFEFPGFSIQMRNVRAYPHEHAAHVLGYTREVNQKEAEDSSAIYSPGDYIGASGLELQYEYLLRGKKGAQNILIDNMGREVGSFTGQTDRMAIPGKNILSTIDIELQSYGEELMNKKIGSIVAIEPSSGEVLAMISSPTYEPSLLSINKDRGTEYKRLEENPLLPFFDRSVMAQYPPGSLFKPLVALIGLQEGLLDLNRSMTCEGAYFFNGMRLVGCHNHPFCQNVSSAIQHSCNTYFITTFREIIDQKGFYNPQEGLDIFNNYLDKFGLGRPTGIDFPLDYSGNYPTSSFFNDYFEREQPGQKWNSIWIRSIGIGQGELLLTNLQMANLAASIANRGYFYKPHLVKEITDDSGNKEKIAEYSQKQETGIEPRHFEPVISGMEAAVTSGTAQSAYIWDIPICGKTGTAENSQRNQEDHSIFFAFAPKDNPKIAIAVYIENGGFGGTYAAPIASLMIEKYIKGEIRSEYRKYKEKFLKDKSLIPAYLVKQMEEMQKQKEIQMEKEKGEDQGS